MCAPALPGGGRAKPGQHCAQHLEARRAGGLAGHDSEPRLTHRGVGREGWVPVRSSALHTRAEPELSPSGAAHQGADRECEAGKMHALGRARRPCGAQRRVSGGCLSLGNSCARTAPFSGHRVVLDAVVGTCTWCCRERHFALSTELLAVQGDTLLGRPPAQASLVASGACAPSPRAAHLCPSTGACTCSKITPRGVVTPVLSHRGVSAGITARRVAHDTQLV